jgi:hypothetical protein
LSFYNRVKADVKTTLQNTVIQQNAYLRMLSEEPLSALYSAAQYQTRPGQARLDPERETLVPFGDLESQKPKFYEDNKYWLLDEVEKYMSVN